MIDHELFREQVERQRRRRWINTLALLVVVGVVLFMFMDLLVRALGVAPERRMLVAVLVTIPATAAGAFVMWVVQRGTGGVAESVMHPPSVVKPEVSTSAAQALFSRGQIDASMDAFEALRREHGSTAPLLRAEADLHLLATGRPERARELLMRLRQLPEVSRADELFATQRLIDLYFGPFNDESRALGEMRRLVDRFPGTRDADGARAELERRRQADSRN